MNYGICVGTHSILNVFTNLNVLKKMKIKNWWVCDYAYKVWVDNSAKQFYSENNIVRERDPLLLAEITLTSSDLSYYLY